MTRPIELVIVLTLGLLFSDLTEAEHERSEPEAVSAESMGPKEVADSSNAGPLSSPKDVPCGSGYEGDQHTGCPIQITFDAYVSSPGYACVYLAGAGYSYNSGNTTHGVVCRTGFPTDIELWRLWSYLPWGIHCGSAAEYRTVSLYGDPAQVAAMVACGAHGRLVRQYSDIFSFYPGTLPDTTEDTPNPEELGPQDNCASSVGY